MRVNLDITDEDIAYAEGVLLPRGRCFDDERRDFIRCLRTVDLQAVPGSGKTTALLAKLLILDRNLPFADGSGILVISHTNVAIDEIKAKIGKHCQRLFSYPNFIGTIQSFVDNFLAIPYYVWSFRERPTTIDNEVYYQAANNFLRCSLKGYTKQEQKNAKHFLIANECCSTFRLVVDSDGVLLAEDVSGAALQLRKPNANSKNYCDWSDVEKLRVRDWLLEFKLKVMTSGILCFDDAYFLAESAIAANPSIVRLLRLRFPSVFVDEMQDMARHQHNLLERLFFEGHGSDTFIQRIGDKNQAIFNGRDMAADDIWADRSEVLTLNNSQRLSAPNARVLAPFALFGGDGFLINGLYPADIMPHMFVYRDDTVKGVVERFAELIVRLYEEGRIDLAAPRIFKVVAWSATWPSPEERRLRLIDFCPTFQVNQQKTTKEFEGLADYLACIDSKDRTLSSAKKGILNGLARVLRFEEVIDERTGRPFTGGSLLGYFRDKQPLWYDRLNLRLYQWSRALVGGEIDRPLTELRAAVPKILRHFRKCVGASVDFIDAQPLTKH